MTDMDAAEQNVKKRLRQYVDAWTAPIVDRSAAVEELILLILHAETVAHEKGRQAGLEEAAYVCTHKLDAEDSLMIRTVQRVFEEVAGDILALKDKPEGGQ